MKLGILSKLKKKNSMAPRKLDNEVILSNYDIIVILLIYGQFEAIQKPDSRCMGHNSYFLISKLFLLINEFPFKRDKNRT